MENKVCRKCNIEKAIENFRLKKDKCGKYYRYSYCKKCERLYYSPSKEKRKILDKKYREKHKEEIKQRTKNKIKNMSIEQKKKKYTYYKIYRENNKLKLNEKRRIYYKKKIEQDLIFKLKCQIRGMIKNSFRRKNFKKKQEAEQIYGCSINHLIKYLIETYENNYNEKWDWILLKQIHIDHIIPLATAKTEEDVIKLCHYSNLQLLKKKDNLEKRDKLNWELF